MIFENRSSYMLKYEKTKAKLVEFNVAEENYPHFPLNPDDLTYTTLYALSRYCEEYIDNPSSEQLPELYNALVVVSQYYDSTVKTGLRQEHSNLFLLLGSTAYFLSENFGSAKVLIEHMHDFDNRVNIITLLYATLRFLLTGKWTDVSARNRMYNIYLGSLKGHFIDGDSPENMFDALHKMRSRIYQSTNVLALSYIDFLFSVAKCAMQHSSWVLLSEYSRMEPGQWKDYLSKPESVKLLWPAQKVIFQSGALVGNNLVVPLPTGVGKTKSIEILLRSKFMSRGTCVAVIIAPLRALCNEITGDLITAFSNEVVINQFTDTAQEDFNLELLFNTKYVFVCTPEKFSYILRHEPEFLHTIQLFIFDEAHLFDDDLRGAQYELLVSEIVRNRDEAAQMILFSAVLSNANQISEWLFKDASYTIDPTLVKTTEKSIGFLSSDQTIHYFEKDNMSEESFLVPRSIQFTSLQLRGKETKPRSFPEKNVQDISIYFANKLCIQGGTAIYAGQARSIPPIMRRIVEINERGYDLSNLTSKANSEEISKLSNLFSLHYGDDSELTKASKLGAFPHYAHLPNGVKMAVEHALRRGHIYFVICTTTLAEGVNIPIKYLLLTTFSYGNANVQIRKMQNLVGRTARSGIHTEGSAIVINPSFYDNRLNWKNGGKYKWNGCKKMFDYGNTEACGSAILSLISNIQIDYDNYYKGSSLSSYLLANYFTESCFSNLKQHVKEGYKNIVAENTFLTHSQVIDQKVDQIQHTIESIENYLCYLFNSLLDQQEFLNSVDTLVQSTFAYYLSADDDKQTLVTIFRMIAHKIVMEIKPESAPYFAKSLYGINISSCILEWVNENIGALNECSMEQLLNEMVGLFSSLFHDDAEASNEILMIIAKFWVNGEPYISIFNSLGEKDGLRLSQIEKICSSTLSYHLSFLIGNVLDAISDQADELSEKLVLLQKQVKYGVLSEFQILVCENIFDDRIIARQLDELLGEKFISDKEFKKYMTLNRHTILKFLEKYPDFFSYKFRIFTR